MADSTRYLEQWARALPTWKLAATVRYQREQVSQLDPEARRRLAVLEQELAWR